jgi:GTPase Era involved in 16S rRNA processing
VIVYLVECGCYVIGIEERCEAILPINANARKSISKVVSRKVKLSIAVRAVTGVQNAVVAATTSLA